MKKSGYGNLHEVAGERRACQGVLCLLDLIFEESDVHGNKLSVILQRLVSNPGFKLVEAELPK